MIETENIGFVARKENLPNATAHPIELMEFSMTIRRSFLRLVLLIIVASLLGTLVGCSASPMASLKDAPEFISDAPPRVQEAYVYAMDHPDDLMNYPCYCGCGNMGHTSNLSCYISEIGPDGTVAWDNHAAGCGICVDITQDVMRLHEEGKSPPEIRAYIDATYSSFGPGTDTPYPTQ
jgi:hypothetical protein